MKLKEELEMSGYDVATFRLPDGNWTIDAPNIGGAL